MSQVQQTLDGSSTVDEHEGEEQCEHCGEWFKRVGRHWYFNSEHRPSLSDKQKEIIIGSLLGDGSYNYQNKYFRWGDMIVKPYLEWLSEQFGCLIGDINHSKSPLERVQEHHETGFGENANKENYSHTFRIQTKCHPELEFCEKWGYSNSGFESCYPNDLELSSMILKIWYVSDGGLAYINGEFQGVQIANTDQIHRIEYLTSLFDEVGLDVSVYSNSVRIKKKDTERFFDYIGSPLTDRDDGFKYKWAYDDYDEYKRLYNCMKEQKYVNE